MLTYAEVKALALSEPLMKRIAESENEVKSLKIVVAKENERAKSLKKEYGECREYLNLLESKRLPAANDTLSKLEKFDDVQRTEVLRQMGELLTPEFISGKETKESVTVFCFTIKVPKKQPEKKPYIILVDNDEEYCVKMSDSAKGNARRVLNFIQSFNKVPNDIQNSIWDTYSKMGSIRNLLDNPDETNIIRLRRAEENLRRIKMLINS